jgi:5-methylcytosine-specific restriction endonuclease McrBC GTP-binding regulatory subunit McrB
MLEDGREIQSIIELDDLFTEKKASPQQDTKSFLLAIYQLIRQIRQTKPRKFIFIIDEINRGEISKIFGELFFSIDPGYRGPSGAVSTQYANLHQDPNDKFYIPENVYIIGTMNDIDRSVDSFDFAMRRRFRFIEIKADDNIEMLKDLPEQTRAGAISRMRRLNATISKTDDLNDNYQIGAAYFLKLKDISFDTLWTDYLEPLLQDYIRGMINEAELMSEFKVAYDDASISD